MNEEDARWERERRKNKYPSTPTATVDRQSVEAPSIAHRGFVARFRARQKKYMNSKLLAVLG
jgi:hypothetical protein